MHMPYRLEKPYPRTNTAEVYETTRKNPSNNTVGGKGRIEGKRKEEISVYKALFPTPISTSGTDPLRRVTEEAVRVD